MSDSHKSVLCDSNYKSFGAVSEQEVITFVMLLCYVDMLNQYRQVTDGLFIRQRVTSLL